MSAAIGPKASTENVSPSLASARPANPPPGLNARRVISKRYSLRDAQGRSLEEWTDIVRRVVGHVSLAETDGDKRDEFYIAMSEVMLNREFVPNTPCLVNAGKANGQLAACFVLDVPDSIASTLKNTPPDSGILRSAIESSNFRRKPLASDPSPRK